MKFKLLFLITLIGIFAGSFSVQAQEGTQYWQESLAYIRMYPDIGCTTEAEVLEKAQAEADGWSRQVNYRLSLAGGMVKITVLAIPIPLDHEFEGLIINKEDCTITLDHKKWRSHKFNLFI